MKKIYACKVYYRKNNENTEYCQLFFRKFENALAAVADMSIFKEYLPDTLLGTLDRAKIFCMSRGDNIADDFEFRYSNGVIVYIGQLYCQD